MRLAVWEVYEYLGERNAAAQMVTEEKAIVFENADSETDKTEYVSNKKSLIYEGGSTLTGRTVIWKGCIKALYNDPIKHFFGMGIANSKELVNSTDYGRYKYTHNQFLEVFVCVGIPGLVLFVIFVLMSLRNTLTVLLMRNTEPVYAFLALCVPILLVANSFEALLLFYRRPGSYLFYLCCGFLSEYVKRLRSNKDHSTIAKNRYALQTTS